MSDRETEADSFSSCTSESSEPPTSVARGKCSAGRRASTLPLRLRYRSRSEGEDVRNIPKSGWSIQQKHNGATNSSRRKRSGRHYHTRACLSPPRKDYRRGLSLDSGTANDDARSLPKLSSSGAGESHYHHADTPTDASRNASLGRESDAPKQPESGMLEDTNVEDLVRSSPYASSLHTLLLETRAEQANLERRVGERRARLDEIRRKIEAIERHPRVESHESS